MVFVRGSGHLCPVIGAVIAAELHQGIFPQGALAEEFVQPLIALDDRGAKAAVIIQMGAGFRLQTLKRIPAAAVPPVLLHNAGHDGIAKNTQQHNRFLLSLI